MLSRRAVVGRKTARSKLTNELHLSRRAKQEVPTCQFRLRSIAITRLFAVSFLLVGTRTAGAAIITMATINSIGATSGGGLFATVTFMDGAHAL
jgi:hypothetical protein